MPSASVTDRYPSLTPDCPQALLFEREIAEQWGIVPEGHSVAEAGPLSARIVPGKCVGDKVRRGTGFRRSPISSGSKGGNSPRWPFGPVNTPASSSRAFPLPVPRRASLHLEISLGYQYRGAERNSDRGPRQANDSYDETVAGDTSIGHATAYCQRSRRLAGRRFPIRTEALRGDRAGARTVGNHAGDLGALAGGRGLFTYRFVLWPLARGLSQT